MAQEPLEIQQSGALRKRILWLYVIVALIDLLIVGQVHHAYTHNGSLDTAPYMLILAGVMLVLPLAFLVGRGSWVKRFDASGVTLRNGKRYPWGHLLKVEDRTSDKMRNFVLYYALVFREGEARVFHRMAENWHELERAIAALKTGDNPFT
jgi:hypothetical protein